MRQAVRVLAGLVLIGVLVQAAAIAGAWFGVINDLDGGATFTEDSDGNVGHAIHGMVGMMLLPLIGLILFVLSFLAKTPGLVKFAGLTFAAIVVQVILAFVSFGVPVIGTLHGINAFVIFGLALLTMRRVQEADTAAPVGAAHAV